MCRTALLLILVLPPPAAAQISFMGAHSAALAGATTGVPGDRRGHANPAAWGHVRHWNAIVHGAQLYGLRELRYADALLLAPVRRGILAFGASTFGYDLYRANTIEIGIGGEAAVGTFRQISIGVRSRLHLVRIQDYGETHAATLATGLQLPVTPFVTLGAAVQNLMARGALRREVPRRLSIGASYRPSTTFTVSADLGKEIRSPASLAAGVELSPDPVVVVRAGVASSPPLLSGGVAFRLSPHVAEITAVRHGVLGWTPSVSVLFTW